MPLPPCDWASSGYGFNADDAAQIDRFGSVIVEQAGLWPDVANASDVATLLGMCWVESRFREGATSKAGAMGLFQLMPATWGAMRESLKIAGSDPYAPNDNIAAGVYYFALLRHRWPLQVQAIAAYFAGTGNVEKFGWQKYRSYVDAVNAAAQRFNAALLWCEGTGPKGTMRDPPKSKGRGVPSSPSSSGGGGLLFAFAAAALALLG